MALTACRTPREKQTKAAGKHTCAAFSSFRERYESRASWRAPLQLSGIRAVLGMPQDVISVHDGRHSRLTFRDLLFFCHVIASSDVIFCCRVSCVSAALIRREMVSGPVQKIEACRQLKLAACLPVRPTSPLLPSPSPVLHDLHINTNASKKCPRHSWLRLTHTQMIVMFREATSQTIL